MAVDYNGFTFERLGHASVKITTPDDTIIYIDPWSDALEGKPGDGDIIFSTHDDMDHYDPDAINAVATDDAIIAVYEEIDTSELGRNVDTLPYQDSVNIAGISVTTIPAYNKTDGDHVDENGNPFHAKREVIGLILEINSTSIYFPSDTDFLDEHREISVDVFIPPIGGHYTMDRHEAAEFAQAVDPELVLPVHYDTFPPIETDANAYKFELESDGITVELF